MTVVVGPRPSSTTTTSPVRTRVGAATAVLQLSLRSLRASAREGDLVVAAMSPVLFFVCFYVPLHNRFERSGIDYAQYLTPVILLQAGIFTAIVAAQNAGNDAQGGMRERLASLPIPRSAPTVARLVAVVGRSIAAVIGGCAIGAALGFRFRGSIMDTIGLLALVIVFTVGLSMLTDALGSVSSNPESTAQVLMIPQLLLVMLSTGFIPAEGFPDWIAPVVRNQPVSQFADALRALSTGTDVDVVAVTAWSLGLLAAGIVCIVATGRAQVRR